MPARDVPVVHQCSGLGVGWPGASVPVAGGVVWKPVEVAPSGGGPDVEMK